MPPDPPPAVPALPSPALAYIRSLARPDLPDGDLLAHAAQRDPEAFAELVSRHGPMVFAVCRRILSNFADAEDATQAAFLVLDRHAASLAGRAAVGDWLHGVAVNTALKARKRRDRRRHVEAAAARPASVDPAIIDDLSPLVDRAVRALPAKLRDAVVLCDLEGVPRRAAAARLGVPEGTLSSRLTAAHQKLARRLARTVAAVAGALTSAEAVGVTVTPAGAAPAAASALALEVSRAMITVKWKLAAATLMVGLGVTGAGVAWLKQDAAAVAQAPAPGYPGVAGVPGPPPAAPGVAFPVAAQWKAIVVTTKPFTSKQIGGFDVRLTKARVSTIGGESFIVGEPVGESGAEWYWIKMSEVVAIAEYRDPAAMEKAK